MQDDFSNHQIATFDSSKALAVLRYAVFTVMVPLVLLIAAYIYNYQNTKTSILNDIENKQSFALHESVAVLKARFSFALTDIRFIANNPVMRQYLNAENDGHRQFLQDYYIDLMTTRSHLYDQLRYMDESGQEVVRINNAEKMAIPVLQQDLQDKSKRYYFTEGISLANNQVYVSPLDLNMENGQVEKPYKPTLRFVSRAVDHQGNLRGVLVINYLGQKLIERLKKINQDAGMQLWLINKEGYWLSADQSGREWGFMFAEGENKQLASLDSNLWTQIQHAAEEELTIHSERGIFSVSGFSPAKDKILNEIELVADQGTDWFLVSYLPAGKLNQQMNAQLNTYLASFLLLTLIVIALGFYTAFLLNRRKLAAIAIAEREHEFHTLIEAAPDVVLVSNEHGIIQRTNAQVQSIFGYTSQELIGRPIEDLMPARNHDIHVQHRAGYLQNPSSRPMGADQILYAQTCDGTEFPVSISLNTVQTAKGRLVISVVRDITEIKNTMDALSDAKEQYSNLASELSVSNKELESFAYSVSHDLRTPLRSVDGFSNILLKKYADKIDDQGKDLLERMREAAQRMGQLIDDMLILSRISRAELERQDCNLSALAQAAIEQLQEAFPQRQVETSIADNLTTMADPKLIRIVLDNLLGNAWKFTAKTDKPHVEFGSHTNNGQHEYFIRDNGIGFDMAYANKLFGPFQRLHSREEFSGTGIGLATVARVIHKHGGSIRAQSSPNEGATFYFTLS